MADMDQPVGDADPGLAGWEHPLARLRRALDEDELQLYCQPILALQAQGAQFPLAEVLVRLREEEQSMLPPGEFLPVFEHYRMLPDLDCWVARKTVEWIAQARPGSIPAYSINVSSQSLEGARLLDFTAGALAKHGVRPERLCLEIDESDTLERAGAAARFAHAARAIGCKVVIDGFARRSVSFAALKALQPDFVKVDGAVIRNIPASPVARLKLQAIVRVGAVTGIGIIAECVEDPGVIATLRQMAVGHAQGFGIAIPQPIEAGGFPPR
ncbi:MAG: EAL domain-containing protein [Proteobacteria bacterium]|nr:EAL domain-containing protein [Pseudomonadota bacterium]